MLIQNFNRDFSNHFALHAVLQRHYFLKNLQRINSWIGSALLQIRIKALQREQDWTWQQRQVHKQQIQCMHHTSHPLPVHPIHLPVEGTEWLYQKPEDVNNYQEAALCYQIGSKRQICNCHRINIKLPVPSNLLEYYQADFTMVSSWWIPFWNKTINELDT